MERPRNISRVVDGVDRVDDLVDRRPPSVTLTEVAQRAGVSRATAARALGGYGSASAAARDRVLAAAAALGYRPNLPARNTRNGTTTTVGVVVADIASPFFGQSTRSISDAAKAAGLEIMVLNTDEELEAERAAVHLLLDQRVAGMVVAAASRTDGRHLAQAQAEGVPVVLLDRRVIGLDADRVYADNGAGAALAMAELIGQGHRRIGYVSSAAGPHGHPPGAPLVVDELVSSGGDRIRAYLAALAEVVDEPTRYLALCPFGEEAAYAATRELLARPDRPTAVFASDSVIALGVLRAIADAGFAVPGDVAVVAGDEPAWSRVTTPPLSTVTQPVAALGRAALELVTRRLADPTSPCTDVVLPTTFQARASTGGSVGA
ncbi:LacI family DNA-binding transcriptional regulator [Microlunatus spumicola]|uniref:LacI family DNA-binding transcriptional regulator n=1 Tax=Microlunatus spumicola TaxID=81499 RepID=A0ABP6XIF9_9ACTN